MPMFPHRASRVGVKVGVSPAKVQGGSCAEIAEVPFASHDCPLAQAGTVDFFALISVPQMELQQ